MKEIDYKILQHLINKEIDTLNFKYVIIFIIINLLIAVINYFFQRNLKTIENSIYKRKIREDRRILIIENVYKQLVEYTYYYTQEEIIKNIGKLSEIERYLNDNRLYIEKGLYSKIINFTDYIKIIATDFRQKDFKNETKLLNSIEIEFNK